MTAPMLRRCLPGVAREALPTWTSTKPDRAAEQHGPANKLDSDTMRRYIQGKAYRTVKRLEDQRGCEQRAMLSWTTTPVDHCLQRLLWLDARGGALQDCCHPSTSPFAACLRDLCSMVTTPIEQSSLQPIFDNFLKCGLKWGS